MPESPGEGPGESAQRLGSCLVRGVQGGDEVFWGHIGQDVVDLLEHVTAAGAPDLEQSADMIPDLPGSGVGENIAGVATAPPEGKTVAEVAFQAGGVHAAAGDLDRIDGFESGIDEVVEEFTNTATAVKVDRDVGGELFGAPPHQAFAGLEKLPVHAW